MGALLDSTFNIKTSIPAAANGNIWSVVLNLCVAVLFGYLLSLLYNRIQPVSKVKKTFLHTMVLLPLVAAAVTLIIGNNLVRAFGLIGAIAVIRFRTVIENTTDMVYVFMSITLGMACGSGLFFLGGVALGIFGASEGVLKLAGYGISSGSAQKYRLTLVADDGEAANRRFKEKMTQLFEAANLREISASKPVSLTYSVKLNKGVTEEKIISTLLNGEGDLIRDVYMKKK